MNLKQAMLTHKRVTRASTQGSDFQYFKPATGPHKNLVSCDYFVIYDIDDEYFSTSLDLYPEDILAYDWEIVKEE